MQPVNPSSPKLGRGMADVTPRHAPTAAYIAAAVNLAAGLVMLLALRYGIPAGESDLSARIAYVGDHILAWRVGWLVWNFAAISLLGFFVVLAARWRKRAPILCGLALLCAAAGLAADLGAETILAWCLQVSEGRPTRWSSRLPSPSPGTWATGCTPSVASS